MTVLTRDVRWPGAPEQADTVRALLHDLRQPLAAILMLAATEGGDTNRKMAVISDQAHWLARLVEVALDEAAGDELSATDVGLLSLDLADRARATARCPIRVVVEDGPVHAWARPVALGRALSCILDNAVRASAGRDGGVVLTVSQAGDMVSLAVSDCGPGVGRIPGRTSLGLTTTRAMVAACHGAFSLSDGASGAVAEILLLPVEDR